MRHKGIVRRVDELGRVVLPIELRRSLDIAERDPLEITVEGETILLRKYQASCVFCSAEAELHQYRGKLICQRCLEGLADLETD